jgi:hypothetical protein
MFAQPSRATLLGLGCLLSKQGSSWDPRIAAISTSGPIPSRVVTAGLAKIMIQEWRRAEIEASAFFGYD